MIAKKNIYNSNKTGQDKKAESRTRFLDRQEQDKIGQD